MAAFPRQKTYMNFPKTRHPQDLLRTAGFVPDSVVSAAELPTEIATTDCDEEAENGSQMGLVPENLVFNVNPGLLNP